MTQKNNKKLFSELLGLMFGDGCLSKSSGKYLIYISGHKKDDYAYHLRNTKRLFRSIFNKEIEIKFRKKEKTLFIRFSDKKIFNTIKKYMPVGYKYDKLRMPGFITRNKEYFCSFMRGLFDTDGCIILSKQHRLKPYYPRIEITNMSKGFLERILVNLRKCGFYGSISFKSRGSYRLELPGFKNAALWRKLINTKNPKHSKKFKRIRKSL